jgi:hypothetical protein
MGKQGHMTELTLRRYAVLTRAFAVLGAALLSQPLHADVQAPAEFILTASSGVYQSSDGRTKVILGHRDGAQGIFVAYFSEGIAPQEFNPETTPAAGATSVFIRFDPTVEHQYSEVVVGARSYRALGNLNIWLTPNGSVSVNIDNTNPFVTVTTRSESGKNDALVGFYGMTEVVKGVGNLATILAANQLSPELAKILRPYTATATGLQLNGKDVVNPSVGLFVSREHECNKGQNDVSILTLSQLKNIQAAKGEAQQAQLLERFLKENQAKPPTAGHLTLRAEKNGPMILLNVASKDIFDMRAIKNSLSKRKMICVVSPID